jgi:hypothetical protein
MTFCSFLRLTYLNVRIKNIEALLDTSKDAMSRLRLGPESGPETALNILVRFVVTEEFLNNCVLIYSNYEEVQYEEN